MGATPNHHPLSSVLRKYANVAREVRRKCREREASLVPSGLVHSDSIRASLQRR